MAISLWGTLEQRHTERERERKRDNSSSRTITGTYYTYEVYLCWGSTRRLLWVVSASTKSSTTRCSCPHHQVVELTVALAVGPLAWAMPAEVVCIVWRCSLSTCCCCNSAVWPLACSIRKAFDQVNTYNVYWEMDKSGYTHPFFRQKWGVVKCRLRLRPWSPQIAPNPILTTW